MFSDGDAYERFMGRWSRSLASRFITFCGIGEHESVLEIGSATGSLYLALQAASDTTEITAIDLSPVYVSYAQSRIQRPRVRFEVGDAQRLRFADSAFDKTLALLVLNFIPDQARALSEMTRVTRPRGLVAAAVWDYPDGMEMLRIFWDEAVAMDPIVDPRDERHMPLCRPTELAALWHSAGLLDVEETALTIPMEFASFDDYWEPFLEGQGPAGAYVQSLSAPQKANLEQRLKRRLTDARPVRLRGRAWAVKGIKPQG